MINFVIGFALGLVVATTGFSSFAGFVDKQLSSAQEIIKENVK